MRAAMGTALLLCLWSPGRAVAHEIHYSIGNGTAVSVRLFFADDNELSFESYEIYRAEEEIPFQVGRTDAHGRLVFLPDRAGVWRVKVFTEDGHGADFSLTTGPQGGVESAERPFFERYSRVLVGVAILFGLFGSVSLFTRRRDTEG